MIGDIFLCARCVSFMDTKVSRGKRAHPPALSRGLLLRGIYSNQIAKPSA